MFIQTHVDIILNIGPVNVSSPRPFMFKKTTKGPNDYSTRYLTSHEKIKQIKPQSKIKK